MFFHLFTFCSVHVSALVIVLSDSLWKKRKMGDLSDCEWGQIVGVRLAGASVTKLHIIRCIKGDNFYGYVSIHESWEDSISEEEQWVKINIDRKRSSYI
jgi:hypothetical protein